MPARTFRLFAILTVFAFSPALLAQTTAKGGLRYSIMVSQFENSSGWSGQWDLGNAWGTVLTDMLNQTGRFIVVAEKDMRAEAMEEQDFAASGRTAGGAKSPVTGQMTPAQLLVKGKITHVQNETAGGGGGISIAGVTLGTRGGKGEVNATIYVVDASTGQVVASKNVIGVSTRKGLSVGYSGIGWSGDLAGFKSDNVGKAVEAACADAVDFIVGQLENVAWSGTVAQTAAGKIYVNRGQREGVQAGDVFVVGHSEVIRDPDSGEVLDSVLTEVARIQVIEVKEKLAIAKVTSGNAQSIRKGMSVRPE